MSNRTDISLQNHKWEERVVWTSSEHTLWSSYDVVFCFTEEVILVLEVKWFLIIGLSVRLLLLLNTSRGWQNRIELVLNLGNNWIDIVGRLIFVHSADAEITYLTQVSQHQLLKAQWFFLMRPRIITDLFLEEEVDCILQFRIVYFGDFCSVFADNFCFLILRFLFQEKIAQSNVDWPTCAFAGTCHL